MTKLSEGLGSAGVGDCLQEYMCMTALKPPEISPLPPSWLHTNIIHEYTCLQCFDISWRRMFDKVFSNRLKDLI